MTEGKDYKITYSVKQSFNFTVEQAELTAESIDGVVVKVGGTTLTDADFTYDVVNNINKGKATVIIKTKDGNRCVGSKTAAFIITSRSIKNYTIQ